MNKFSLAGKWQVTWTDGQHGQIRQFVEPVSDPQRYLTLSFPGSIHSQLEQVGLLQDPRIGIHSLHARWVEEQYWILRRTFELAAEAVDEPVYLHIDVLDGVAQVAVNGQVVGSHANANRPVDIDITGKLRTGSNEVAILLESGLFHVAELPGKDYSLAQETILVKRYHLRQAQYQFGWDWNPRLVMIGLHGGIDLVWGSGPWLKQVSVLGEVAADLESARIRVKPQFELTSGAALPVTLELSSFEGLSTSTEVVLQPGTNEAEIVLEIDQPHLWWPRGHGEAFLYPLALSVMHNGAQIAAWEGRTGLRRVEIDQPPHPESGRYFHLKINNRPVFCKGANWVPPELCGHDVSLEKLERLVSLAEEENMNTLRLWGGGVWANHPLLSLCDERGILVWHDLLFACAKYPADRPEFLAEVEQEVSWGIREFSPHPSLVVWCGNNELEWGLWEWRYKDFGKTAPDMVLFHHLIPTLMARLDPTRPYWPSSPYSSNTEKPNSPITGDQHPWNVSLGSDDINFWAYRDYVDRFPNEGGVLGCAPVDSLRQFLSPDQLHLRSFAWEHHENTILYGRAEPGFSYRAVEHWLGLKVSGMDLGTYALASGLLQSEGLKEYILNYRRRWPSTSSAIYWMFNDSWPTVHGWGTFDYYLNRKLSFHPVRRAFGDNAVVVADEGEKLGVYAINDSGQPVSLILRYGSFTPGQQLGQDPPVTVEIPAYTSLRVGVMARDPQRIAYAVLRDQEGRGLAQDRLLLRPFCEWSFTIPEIQVGEVTWQGQQFARYTSSSWVWGVVLDPSGKVDLADDVFDLLPGIPYDVPLKDGEMPHPVVATGNQLLGK